MNYKDVSVAKTRFGQIKKKKMGGAATGGGVKASPTKASPTKRGSKDMADSGTEVEASPKKRGKKATKAKEVNAETKSADVEDEGEAGSSKKDEANGEELKVKAELTE